MFVCTGENVSGWAEQAVCLVYWAGKQVCCPGEFSPEKGCFTYFYTDFVIDSDWWIMWVNVRVLQLLSSAQTKAVYILLHWLCYWLKLVNYVSKSVRSGGCFTYFYTDFVIVCDWWIMCGMAWCSSCEFSPEKDCFTYFYSDFVIYSDW